MRGAAPAADVERELNAIGELIVGFDKSVPPERKRRIAIAVLTIAAIEDPRLYDRAWAALRDDRARRIEARTASCGATSPLGGEQYIDLTLVELVELVDVVRALASGVASPERTLAARTTLEWAEDRLARGGTVHGPVRAGAGDPE